MLDDQAPRSAPLYTPEERARRDASPWTRIQGVLAIAQFAVFLVSLALVLRALWTGEGHLAASVSVVVKTAVLLQIMVAGAVWEREVFGRYLFADAFFWEDVVSFVVIALHLAYVAVLLTDALPPTAQLQLALTAYAAYVLNAAQFLRKLRHARMDAL